MGPTRNLGACHKKPKWNAYQKNVETTIGIVAIQWKNVVITIRFWGCEAKPKHDFKGVGGLKEGNEDVKIESQTHRSLPQSDGGIRQPQNGICHHEGKTPNLSTKEQKEPSRTMETT